MLYQLEFDFGNLMMIINIIISSLLISGYIFIVIGGASNLKGNEKLKGSIFLLIIGVVEIIYEHFKWLLQFDFFYEFFNDFEFSYRFSYTISYIVPHLISIITFGVLILILGVWNKENLGKSLITSGILMIIYAANQLIFSSLLYDFLPLTLPANINAIIIIISTSIIAFLIVSRIFLLLYAIKIKEKYLLTSSIILLIASQLLLFYKILELIYLFII
ncbi:MAG: hypothetical protein ACFFBP_00890 [Promethearchaeota archaeon]